MGEKDALYKGVMISVSKSSLLSLSIIIILKKLIRSSFLETSRVVVYPRIFQFGLFKFLLYRQDADVLFGCQGY